MGLVWMRWRSDLRTRWRGIALASVLVGVGGGMALTALAGADRSDTAMPRFIAYSRVATGAVGFGNAVFDSDSPIVPPSESSAVLKQPQVEQYYRMVYLFTTVGTAGPGNINTFATPDPDTLRTIVRPHVVRGHLPDPGSPFQVSINELLARKGHLSIGSTLRIRAYSIPQLRSVIGTGGGNPGPPLGPAYEVRVGAVIRLPTDVNAIVPIAAKQNVVYEGQENIYLTPAFMQHLAGDLHMAEAQIPGMNFYSVRLHGGAAGWKPFVTRATAATAHAPLPVQFVMGDSSGSLAASRSAQRGIRVEVVALILFGALSALVTVLLVGQAFSRQVQAEADDYSRLRTLGATRPQLVGVVLLRAAIVGVAGAVIAFAAAALASPLMPVGLARQAEIHPGFEVNLAILLTGAAVLALLVVVRSSLPAWKVARQAARSSAPAGETTRPSVVARALSSASAPLTALIGVRFGLEGGRGSRAVPVVSALAGAVVAVAGLTTALTFGASLDHLVGNPAQQGWNWDVLAGNPNAQDDNEAAGNALLAHNRLVGSYSVILNLGAAQVDRTQVPTTLAIDPLRGSVFPKLLGGRAPIAPDEIVLGTRTLQAVHKHIGDQVQLGAPDGHNYTLTVVGRMLAPSVGDMWTNSLGEGVWLSGSFVHQQWRSSSNPAGTPPSGTDVFNMFAVRYAAGVSPAAAFASLRRQFGNAVLQQLPGEDAVNLNSVSDLPFALAGLIAVLGVATVGNTLVASVRRRRRDLATLKTLGFVRRQVYATVCWQATSAAAVALIVGLPLGLAAGRWAWSAVAAGIDSVSPPVVPSLVVAAVVPATVLLCNVLAAWPAFTAGRLAPALVMRSE